MPFWHKLDFLRPRRAAAALALLAALLLAPAVLHCPAGSARAYTKPVPRLRLKAVSKSKLYIDKLADYRADRMHEGVGWKIASAVRGTTSGALNDVMRGGYTVFVPEYSEALPLRHYYCLAAFDFLPRQQMLVVIRDPEQYWTGYDYRDRLSDVLELVWYEKDWTECTSVVLDYGPEDYPDDFRLSPDQSTLIAIRHSLGTDGELRDSGHSLDVVYTHDGEIKPLYLPEADERGALPVEWYPVYMQWDEDQDLQVVTKQGTRVYGVEW
ncbi:hypothetical protein IT575_08965 [bacterium]|nr:hypothetical protein [bacterium]